MSFVVSLTTECICLCADLEMLLDFQKARESFKAARFDASRSRKGIFWQSGMVSKSMVLRPGCLSSDLKLPSISTSISSFVIIMVLSHKITVRVKLNNTYKALLDAWLVNISYYCYHYYAPFFSNLSF